MVPAAPCPVGRAELRPTRHGFIVSPEAPTWTLRWRAHLDLSVSLRMVRLAFCAVTRARSSAVPVGVLGCAMRVTYVRYVVLATCRPRSSIRILLVPTERTDYGMRSDTVVSNRRRSQEIGARWWGVKVET